MKLFFDFLPIVLFFIAYKLYGIYAATATVMVAVGAQVAVTLIQGKKPEIMLWVTLVMVLLMGGATLAFHNEDFIKFKPTVVYWVLSVIFTLSHCVTKHNLVQKMLQSAISLPKPAWALLNYCWVAFFFIMGLLNIMVVYWFDTQTWVHFKLFGTLIMTVLFAIVQGVIIARYLPKNNSSSETQV